jgi:hypothetical protein
MSSSRRERETNREVNEEDEKKEETKKKGKWALDYCEDTPLLRDHDDTRKTEGQGITASATATPTLPLEASIIIHPVGCSRPSIIVQPTCYHPSIHPSIKMVPLVCHPSLSADLGEMDRQNKIIFFYFQKFSKIHTYLLYIF